MDTNFPRCMKAAKASDVGQWELADALMKEVEDKVTGPRGFTAVMKDFQEIVGLDLGLQYLQQLRSTAAAFPANRRYDGEHNKPVVSLKSHTVATSPDMLDALVAISKTEGVPLSLRNIGTFLKTIRAEEREARREQHQEAKRQQAEADAEAEQARARVLHAKNEREREQAKREREAAQKRKQEAKERVKETQTPPTKKMAPPKPEQSVGLLFKSQFMARASEAHAILRSLKKSVQDADHQFTPAFIDGGVEDMLNIANTAREVADLLRKRTGNKRGHLYAVGE